MQNKTMQLPTLLPNRLLHVEPVVCSCRYVSCTYMWFSTSGPAVGAATLCQSPRASQDFFLKMTCYHVIQNSAAVYFFNNFVETFCIDFET